MLATFGSRITPIRDALLDLKILAQRIEDMPARRCKLALSRERQVDQPNGPGVCATVTALPAARLLRAVRQEPVWFPVPVVPL